MAHWHDEQDLIRTKQSALKWMEDSLPTKEEAATIDNSILMALANYNIISEHCKPSLFVAEGIMQLPIHLADVDISTWNPWNGPINIRSILARPENAQLGENLKMRELLCHYLLLLSSELRVKISPVTLGDHVEFGVVARKDIWAHMCFYSLIGLISRSYEPSELEGPGWISTVDVGTSPDDDAPPLKKSAVVVGPARLLNSVCHQEDCTACSKGPNCEIVLWDEETYPFVYIRTTRQILKGEELLLSHSFK